MRLRRPGVFDLRCAACPRWWRAEPDAVAAAFLRMRSNTALQAAFFRALAEA